MKTKISQGDEHKQRIAIVGMACRYPDAASPQELWENCLAQRRAFRRLPSERLKLDDYYDPQAQEGDNIYITRAAVLEGWEFNRVGFRITGSSFRSADLTHWLALEVAAAALADAGFPDGDGLPRDNVGVLMGNTLTGEFSRATLMRLRWPYVHRMLVQNLLKQDWESESLRQLLLKLEHDYKAPFPPIDEESLAGGLSNTIAGRICNHFNLGGGGYTLDGACSSSLLAVANACSALMTGDLDMALAGGVDLSLDPFELIGFARTGALSRTCMRVYDRRSDGFWPGEGCGMLVLMRHQDALSKGLDCYALIGGWGISSDGSGSITRPEVRGQRLALERAYRKAGFGIDSVTLFEGHGTGTAVGDTVELRALKSALGDTRHKAALSSVKANIGHTKAAAGAAGLIKTVMALNTQLLPPVTAVDLPHDELTAENTSLRLLQQGEPWPQDQPLRAGVSSFGFGGINVHLALEGAAPLQRNGLTEHDQRLVCSAQDTELFFLEADDREGLLSWTRQLAEVAPRMSQAELTDLAAHLARRTSAGPWRAALLAAEPERLAQRLEALAGWLDAGEERRLEPGQGLFLGRIDRAPRIGLLFSGQASPVRLDGGAMARRFTLVEQLYREADLPTHDTGSTAVAQPAIVAAQRAVLQLLERLGIQASLALGHSLGEYAALHWAGAFDGAQLQHLARVRGALMDGVGGPKGGMAAIQANGEQVEYLLDRRVVVSCFNSPHQTVISGEAEAVAGAAGRARAAGLRITELPVSHAFHSSLMQPAVEELGREIAAMSPRPLQRLVISTVNAAELSADADLCELLQRQMTSPVLFTKALEAFASRVDLCFEVGPGQVLSGLAEACNGMQVFPLDGAGGALAPFLIGVAAAYACGVPMRREALFDDRLTRPFDPCRELRFLANPCEAAPVLERGALMIAETAAAPDPKSLPKSAADTEEEEVLELLRTLVAQKAELPPEAVEDDSRLLVDLHLNSISVGQIVVDAARSLGLPAPSAPADYADATLAGVARALDEQLTIGGTGQLAVEAFPAGVDQWVHGFELVWRELPPPPAACPAKGDWGLFRPTNCEPSTGLEQTRTALPGRGTLVWLPKSAPQDHLELLLKAVAHALDRKSERFVLVQHGAAAAPLARTMYLEHPELSVSVLDLPDDESLPRRLVDEAGSTLGYHEVRFDPDGRRLEPFLVPLADLEVLTSVPLGAGDVLLVSGGGKGIAAECALALARDGGARLALLGRSEPDADAELETNLERFTAQGVEFRYYAADVTDQAAVLEVVHCCTRELGPVTGLLHGAGLNRPRLLHELTGEALRATLAPKLGGLENLLSALDGDRLQTLITFGSIIALSGLHGEADYAIANEALARRTEAFGQTHPGCRCLCLEWSIWSGVGMGERLGRVDALLREGITPIGPEQGIQVLGQLLARSDTPVRVIVSGRLGVLSTLRLQRPELPFRRFLEPVRIYYPGIELVVEPELNSATDPYLADHALEGTPLFPTVMGLEAMAQAAMALVEGEQPPDFSDVELLRPIAVADGRSQTLRIAALKRDQRTVDVVLRVGDDGFLQDHFRARCHFDTAGAEPEPLVVAEDNPPQLHVERDIYEQLLFHHGGFRRISAYRHLAAYSCCAQIAVGDGASWFGAYLPPDLELGDPGSRDAGLHAIQACIPHARLLPVGVQAIRFGDPLATGPWVVRARETARDGDLLTYDMELRGRDGSLRETWHGLRLRRVAYMQPTHWPPGLLHPYLERRVAELLPDRGISLALDHNADAKRRERSDRAIRRALGMDTPVLRRNDGRPETLTGHSVSAAHAGDLTLAVTSRGMVTCDLEPVTPRAPQVWRELLGDAYWELAQSIAARLGEDTDKAAGRIWGALECLKKAGAITRTPLVLDAAETDGWTVLSAGRRRIAGGIVSPDGCESKMVLTLLGDTTHADL